MAHDVCPRCNNEIDPDTCHCGDVRSCHAPDHSFVPMGCECGRVNISDFMTTHWMVEVGQPNETPMPTNVMWEHPRVDAASKELHAAAVVYSKALAKQAKCCSFSEFEKACCRMENAAIAFGYAVREYTIK